MTSVTLDLRIDDDAWNTLVDIEEVASSALLAGAETLERPVAGEVAILLTGDEHMHALNKTWRDKDAPTDVLSFPASEADPGFLGDLALGFGICARDAKAQNLSLSAHLSHLVIHGFYHLLGYDHETDDDAAIMEALEVSALARLGLSDPYSLRA
ncbi:MAG: rRNA maturation RNase YbeY [Pseudomonadota bacterium]